MKKKYCQLGILWGLLRVSQEHIKKKGNNMGENVWKYEVLLKDYSNSVHLREYTTS